MLKLFKAKNKKKLSKIIQSLNQVAEVCQESELETAMLKLENDIQKNIYLDWWYGGSLWKWNKEKKDHDRADKYKNINDYDWNKACSMILETISRGMG